MIDKVNRTVDIGQKILEIRKSYINQGIGSVWVVMLSMPVALIAALLVALALNCRKDRS